MAIIVTNKIKNRKKKKINKKMNEIFDQNKFKKNKKKFNVFFLNNKINHNSFPIVTQFSFKLFLLPNISR